MPLSMVVKEKVKKSGYHILAWALQVLIRARPAQSRGDDYCRPLSGSPQNGAGEQRRSVGLEETSSSGRTGMNSS